MLKLKLQYFGHLMWRIPRKRPWCWKRLKSGKEGDNKGWEGWMTSLTQWTWVWASSGSWWWTGKPGMLQSMGSQKVQHNWVTELNWGIRNSPNVLKNFLLTTTCLSGWGWTKCPPILQILLTLQILLMGQRSHFPPEGQSKTFISWSGFDIRVNLSTIWSIIQV